MGMASRRAKPAGTGTGDFGFRITSDLHTTVATEGAPVEVQKAYGPGNSPNLLLYGLRAGLPGQWSDNRFIQAQKFTGVLYTAVSALMAGASAATLEVLESDPELMPEDFDPDMPLPGAQGAGADEEQNTGFPVPDYHPVRQLFDNPNPQQTLADVIAETVLQLKITGNCLTWLVPDALDMPAEMYVIPTAITQAMPISTGYPNGAWRVMPLLANGPFATIPGIVSAAGAVLPNEEVVHLMEPHTLLKYDGYSALTAGSVQLDLMDMIDKARWSAMENGIHPGLALEIDPIKGANIQTADLERLQGILDQKYGGTGKFGRGMVLPPGMSANPFTTSPAEMAFDAGWEQMRDFVLSVFQVPKGALGIIEASSYAALYASLQQYWMLTLTPLCRKIATVWTKHIASRWSKTLTLKLRLPKLQDPTLRQADIAQDDTAGIRTWNERRAIRGLPPLKGEEYERLMAFGPPQTEAERQQQAMVERNPADAERPENPAGKGSLPERIKSRLLNGHGDRLAHDLALLVKSEFREQDHPRDDVGKFGEGAATNTDHATAIRKLYDRSGDTSIPYAEIESTLAALSDMDKAELLAVADKMELMGMKHKTRSYIANQIQQKVLDRRSSAQREQMIFNAEGR